MIEGREPYYTSHFNHGLVSTEDVVFLMDRMGIKSGINYGNLMLLASKMKDRLDEFNKVQVRHGQETMPCRSFMQTTGALPQQVTDLADISAKTI
jgi:hypothetical protein